MASPKFSDQPSATLDYLYASALRSSSSPTGTARIHTPAAQPCSGVSQGSHSSAQCSLPLKQLTAFALAFQSRTGLPLARNTLTVHCAPYICELQAIKEKSRLYLQQGRTLLAQEVPECISRSHCSEMLTSPFKR